MVTPLRTTIARLVTVVATVGATLAALAAAPEPVTLRAADGTQVFGDVYRSASARPPVIVAFHQAESSAAEYAPIAPRLVKAGFTVLAIDQRQGGGNFGGTNRTVAALGGAKDYDAALPDLEAALAWGRAEAKGAPVIVWGSSYSASLVFVLAAKHPGAVSGVVAMSPAEYLADEKAVRAAAALVTVPVFIDQASDAEEVTSARAVLAAVKGTQKQQFIARGKSTHGSSTLRADTNAAGAEAHWQAVLKFLARYTRP